MWEAESAHQRLAPERGCTRRAGRSRERIVGLDSVCKQNTGDNSGQVTEIAGMGLSLHGVKIQRRTAYSYYPASTDSVVERRSAQGE
jgi:hypothetical protein